MTTAQIDSLQAVAARLIQKRRTEMDTIVTTASIAKERGILFSGDMVRAILDGRKTQTRRVVKPQPVWKDKEPGTLESPGWYYLNKKTKLSNFTDGLDFGEALLGLVACPYGKPGDPLWVRETISVDGYLDIYYSSDDKPVMNDVPEDYYYKDPEYIGKIPSIHMPRWASRIDLEILNVRLERLQDISEDDAIAEGVGEYFRDKLFWPNYWLLDGDDFTEAYLDTARDSFETLWDSLNEKRGYGWEDNPWLWVIEFRRVRP